MLGNSGVKKTSDTGSKRNRFSLIWDRSMKNENNLSGHAIILNYTLQEIRQVKFNNDNSLEKKKYTKEY